MQVSASGVGSWFPHAWDAITQTYRSTNWKLPGKGSLSLGAYTRDDSQWGSQFPFSGACCPESTRDSGTELGSRAEYPTRLYVSHFTHLCHHSDDTDSYSYFLSKKLAAATSSTRGLLMQQNTALWRGITKKTAVPNPIKNKILVWIVIAHNFNHCSS